MLARCVGESLFKLMGGLDRTIAAATERSTTIDEVNPPLGF